MGDREHLHMGRVKELSCAVCGAPGPNDAHHILEGRTPGRKSPGWLCVPLCRDCHEGSVNGIHGQRVMWTVHKMSELQALANTIERLYG